MKNRCYDCNFKWPSEDGDSCPNCNSLDSDNLGKANNIEDKGLDFDICLTQNEIDELMLIEETSNKTE